MGNRKPARKTSKSDRRKVLGRLSHWTQGLIVMINLRDGIRLGHLEGLPYAELLDDFVLACGGEQCEGEGEAIYRLFRDMIFENADKLRFRRQPPPGPTPRICVVVDRARLKEVAPNKAVLDAVFDGHGDLEGYARSDENDEDAARQLIELAALEGGMLGKPPRIVWASCHGHATKAMNGLTPARRADALRNLLGIDCFPRNTALFLLDLPFPSNDLKPSHLAAPTVFEAPDMARFKSRYDDADKGWNHWGVTADLSKAYVNLPNAPNADGLPEIVVRPIRITEDFGLEALGILSHDTPGTAEDHLRYLLLTDTPDDVVEELAA